MTIISNTDVDSWLGNTGAHAFRDNHHEVPFRFRNSFVPGQLIGPKKPGICSNVEAFSHSLSPDSWYPGTEKENHSSL
jgi:hypothetical protein